MIDRLTWFFVDKVHAQAGQGLGGLGGALSGSGNGSKFFNLFNPFNKTPGGNAQVTFASIVGVVITWVLAIVAIIAFIYLIMSGVNYITAGGDAEKATKARSGILNAIIGIVVIALSFYILNFAVTLGGNLGANK